MALWQKRRRETGACGMNDTDEVSGQIQRTQNSCDEANQITHASFSFSVFLCFHTSFHTLEFSSHSAYSLVGFSQSLSASQQYFSLTTNQHQPGLSAQKPTNEHADCCMQYIVYRHIQAFYTILLSSIVGL